MLSLLFEIHFWTSNDEVYVSNNDFGAFKYYDKKETTKSLSYEKKKNFAEGRNYQWMVSNKRPYKLKQYLKELEDHVESQRIVRVKWLREDTVVLFFNSGIVTYIGIDVNSGDIQNVHFDKFSKDKLLSVHVSDILMTNVFSICCYNDPQMTLIYYAKPQFKKLYKKLNDLDPKFASVNLPGPNGRRLPRKLCANKTGDVIAVWWNYSENDIFPWSPLVKDVDRANIHVYSVSGCKMEILCYHRTEFDLLCVAFSSVESNVMFIVEQKISREGNVSVESGTYEIIKCSRLQRISVVSIALQSKACCVEFSPDRSNLLLGCVDGSVVLYNQTRALTHIVRTVFVPSVVRWHADGFMAAVASERGQLQCFDCALTCIKMQSISEDITPSNVIDLSVYFTQISRSQNPPLLVQMEWNIKTKDSSEVCTDDGFILMTFGGGPLVMLRVLSAANVTPFILMTQYLNADQVDKGINLLLAMDWDTNASVCLTLLTKLSNYIFVSSLSNPSEKYAQLQMALGSFYFPVRPINHSVEVEFYKSVRNISRRLFHYLLRHDMSDLAFNIAVYLNEHDLFMDLYYYAKSVDSVSLQASAWEKAEQILLEESANISSSNSECCSCSGSSSASDTCSFLEIKGDDHVAPIVNPIVKPPVVRTSFASVSRLSNSAPQTIQTQISEHLPSSHRTAQSTESTQSAKQKVKFSDVITKITLPDDQDDQSKSNSSQQINETENILTNFYISPNSNLHKNIPSEIAQELLRQSTSSDDKLPESKTIKVVHFGVV